MSNKGGKFCQHLQKISWFFEKGSGKVMSKTSNLLQMLARAKITKSVNNLRLKRSTQLPVLSHYSFKFLRYIFSILPTAVRTTYVWNILMQVNRHFGFARIKDYDVEASMFPL